MSLISKLKNTSFWNAGTWADTKAEIAKTTAVGIGAMSLYQALGYGLGQFPDILIGFIPIYTAKRYEMAFSQDVLKYRAVGGEFLAQQRGGNVAFKAVIYLHRIHGLGILRILELLYIAGQEYEKFNKNLGKVGYNAATVQGVKGFMGSPMPVSGAGPTSTIPITTDGGNVIPKTDEYVDLTQRDSYFTPIRFTVPVVTRENIMFNMYIESMITEIDVEYGDWMKVSLLMRQWQPLPEIDEKASGLVGVGGNSPTATAEALFEGGRMSLTDPAVLTTPQSSQFVAMWEPSNKVSIVCKVTRKKVNAYWVSLARFGINIIHSIWVRMELNNQIQSTAYGEINYPTVVSTFNRGLNLVSKLGKNRAKSAPVTLVADDCSYGFKQDPTIGFKHIPSFGGNIYTGKISTKTEFYEPKNRSYLHAFHSGDDGSDVILKFGTKEIEATYNQRKLTLLNEQGHGINIALDNKCCINVDSYYLYFRPSPSNYSTIICESGS